MKALEGEAVPELRVKTRRWGGKERTLRTAAFSLRQVLGLLPLLPICLHRV